MKNKNTKQNIASNPEHSVWVAASAGTGKTKILTDRVLRLLLCKVPADKILCLTFTKAAAKEMQERIFAKLEYWTSCANLDAEIEALIDAKPDAELVEFARFLFLNLLDSDKNLQIQTIHSYAQKLISNFALEAGISPTSRVMTDPEKTLLFKQAWDELLLNATKDASLKSAITLLLKRTNDEWLLERLVQTVSENSIELIDLFTRFPTEETLLSNLKIKLDLFENIDKQQVVKEFIDSLLPSLYLEIARELASGKITDQKLSSALVAFFAMEKPEQYKNYFQLNNLFLTSEKKSKVKLVTKDFVALEPALQDLQTEIMILQDKIEAINIYENTREFVRLLSELLLIYHQKKQQASYLDYNDLIYRAKELLTASDLREWILYKLDGGIEHILVDEAQDTSILQWEIVEKLTEEFFSGETASTSNRTLFVVGDEKQSIYSFQGADPLIFNEKEKNFAAKIQSSNLEMQNISLDISYRSVSEILSFVDGFFNRESYFSSVSKNPNEIKHIPFRAAFSGRVELWPLTVCEKSEEEFNWDLPIRKIEETNSKRISAQYIVSQIKNWFQTRKDIEPRDILILVRKRTSIVKYLISELKKNNINVSGPDRLRLYDDIVSQDIVSFFKFLNLPNDDLNFACLLKTPIFNLDDKDIQLLALNRKDSLWQSLCAKPQYAHIAQMLLRFLKIADLEPVYDILLELISVEQVREKFIARIGNDVNLVLDEILDLALAFNNTINGSIQEFLNFFETEAGEIKRDPDSAENAVRIMTVHGSKGLQAKIVILAETTSIPKAQTTNLIIEDRDIIFAPSVKHSFIADKKTEIARQEYEEYLRLLYVALTRAEDEIYISGDSEKPEVSDKSWYHILRDELRNIGAEEIEGKLIIKPANEEVKIEQAEKVAKAIDFAAELNIDLTISKPEPVKYITSKLETNIVGSDVNYIDSEQARKRGIIIHRLLQVLPQIEVNSRTAFIENYLKETPELKQIAAQILASEFFETLCKSQAYFEVPVLGKIGKDIFSGRIDCMIVGSDIQIIDVKTGKNVPVTLEEVPPEYIHQLNCYRELVQKIHPNLIIRTALFFTEEMKLVEV